MIIPRGHSAHRRQTPKSQEKAQETTDDLLEISVFPKRTEYEYMLNFLSHILCYFSEKTKNLPLVTFDTSSEFGSSLFAR